MDTLIPLLASKVMVQYGVPNTAATVRNNCSFIKVFISCLQIGDEGITSNPFLEGSERSIPSKVSGASGPTVVDPASHLFETEVSEAFLYLDRR